jgi:hypothetical protein
MNPPQDPEYFQQLQPLIGKLGNQTSNDSRSIEKVILKSMNFIQWKRCK